jgi:Tol biopolymer transport system component
MSSSSVLLGQQPNESADQQLKAAMHRELVGGDLRAAIKEYEGIVSRYRDNRPVAARALLQIAQCHDKLGQTDARKVYEQIVRDYADQTEPVALARTRLTAMNAATAETTPKGAGVSRPLPDAVGNLQSISPDGTKAAGVDYSKGMNLVVYDLRTHDQKLLTDFDWTTTIVVDAWSAWSPDGRQIAYTQIGVKGGPSELRMTSLTGNVRTLFRSESGSLILAGDWLPNGQSIVASLGRSDRTAAIGLISSAGGSFTPLRSLQWSGGYPDQPRVSPDGRFVLFSDAAAGPRDIQVVSVDGRTSARLTDHPAEDRSPVWSPDGRHVAFVSSRLGSDALWVVPVKDGRPAGEPGRVREIVAGATLTDWTPKGLVYRERTRRSDIYTVAVDPTTRQAGRPQQLEYGRTGRNVAPVWSSDGRHLAFVSGSPAEPNRRFVVVLPEKGGTPREFLIPTTRFGEAGTDPFDLRWIGDGSGLGFSGSDDQGVRSVFRLSLASGAWSVLPSPSQEQTAVEWDQSARHLFFTQAGGHIVERNLETNQDRPLTRHDPVRSIARGLRISPDRRLLAFTWRPNPGVPETPRVMLTDIQSGETRTLLEDKTPATADDFAIFGVPAWSPDGRSILVPRSTNRKRWPELLIVPIDGTASRSIPVDSSFVRAARGTEDISFAMGDVVWTPDGTHITFAVASTLTQVSIIESVVPPAKSTASQRRQP